MFVAMSENLPYVPINDILTNVDPWPKVLEMVHGVARVKILRDRRRHTGGRYWVFAVVKICCVFDDHSARQGFGLFKEGPRSREAWPWPDEVRVAVDHLEGFGLRHEQVDWVPLEKREGWKAWLPYWLPLSPEDSRPVTSQAWR